MLIMLVITLIMLASNGYFPLITLCTHVTDVSSTLIDHFVTNDHKIFFSL